MKENDNAAISSRRPTAAAAPACHRRLGHRARAAGRGRWAHLRRARLRPGREPWFGRTWRLKSFRRHPVYFLRDSLLKKNIQGGVRMTLTSVAKPAGQRWADDRPRNIERLHATVGALGRESGGGTARDGRENEGPLPHLHQAKQQRSCFGRPTLRHVRRVRERERERERKVNERKVNFVLSYCQCTHTTVLYFILVDLGDFGQILRRLRTHCLFYIFSHSDVGEKR